MPFAKAEPTPPPTPQAPPIMILKDLKGNPITDPTKLPDVVLVEYCTLRVDRTEKMTKAEVEKIIQTLQEQ